MIKKKHYALRIKILFFILTFILLCSSCVSDTNDPDNHEIDDGSTISENDKQPSEQSEQEENYYDILDIKHSDFMFISDKQLPGDKKATTIREELCSDISTFAAVKIRTILDDAVSYMGSLLGQYNGYAHEDDDQFWIDLESGKVKYMPESTNYKPLSIDTIISDLQRIKEYVDNPKVSRDIEAAQKLMLYAKMNQNIEGIVFAHHILSDLAYWGFVYDLDMRGYSKGNLQEVIWEFNIFYGITNAWGYEYPEKVKTIIDDPSVGSIESMENPDFITLVENKDKEIEQLISEFSPDDLKLMKEKLSTMNETLSLILNDIVRWNYGSDTTEFFTPEIQKHCDQLMSDISTCLSISPKGALEDDLKYIQLRLAEYHEIQKTNSQGLDMKAADCFIKSKRTVNELSKIVFDNVNPINYNERYYSMTKTLEGGGAIR